MITYMHTYNKLTSNWCWICIIYRNNTACFSVHPSLLFFFHILMMHYASTSFLLYFSNNKDNEGALEGPRFSRGEKEDENENHGNRAV